ncbi:hypothetical protein A2U01_0102974, partial [Trifolium medium]|nr:hypothetical protein [Trifolium medium]
MLRPNEIWKIGREKSSLLGLEYTSFNNQNPPKFCGDGGPAVVDLWLQAMEKIFGAIHCPEEE